MPPASVFIVEDELIEAEDIRQTLESLGYAVSGIARSGEVALERLGVIRPDLVLMDIHLAGGIDGIEAAEKIHTLYNIPLIYLTAHADEASLERAKVTEPYGYVIKPFDERELHSSIEMALYKHRMGERERENERTIRVLANAIPDAVMLISPDNRILALNDAMALRLEGGYPVLQDKPLIRFDSHGCLTSLESQIHQVMQSGRPVRFEERCGDEWFEISVIRVGSGGDLPYGILVQYHDITDHKQFEGRLKTEGITRIEQNMEQFQILNDQIRNPLQAIMGYVMLDCEGNRERIIQQVGVIDSLVNRLDHGWVESEKVRQFLVRHYRDSTDRLPDTREGRG